MFVRTFLLKRRDVAIMDSFIKKITLTAVNGLNIINYIICNFIVNHSFSAISQGPRIVLMKDCP